MSFCAFIMSSGSQKTDSDESTEVENEMKLIQLASCINASLFMSWSMSFAGQKNTKYTMHDNALNLLRINLITNMPMHFLFILFCIVFLDFLL